MFFFILMVIFHELLGLKNMEKKRWNIVIQWWFIGISLALSWWRLARELMMVDGKHHYSTTLYLDIKPIHVGWNPLSDAYFMGIYTSIYLHIFPSDPTYSNSRTIHGHGQTPFRRPCQVPLVLHVCGAFHCAHGLGIPEALPRYERTWTVHYVTETGVSHINTTWGGWAF